MNRKLSAALIFTVFLTTAIHSTNAAPNKLPEPFEIIFPKFGFKSVDEAINEFEKHYNQSLKLPLRIPLISFTHHFGRYSDLAGERNDHLKIKYVSDENPANHYNIEVRHIKNKITLKPGRNRTIYTLPDGQKALYVKDQGFNFLFYEKEKWQYIFAISRKASNKVPPHELVRIANSIQ